MSNVKDWTMEPASKDNPLTPVPMGKGCAVYFDGFSGTIPCKIVRVYQETDYPSGITHTYVTATVGESGRGYTKGEEITHPWDRFCPRASRVVRGHEYRIRMNFHPVITED